MQNQIKSIKNMPSPTTGLFVSLFARQALLRPGRLQWLDVLGRRVLLDGAHNLQAAEALARGWPAGPYPFEFL